MANVLVEETSLQDIADAIREKTETEDTFKPSEMGEAIRGISSGEPDAELLKKAELLHTAYQVAFGDNKTITEVELDCINKTTFQYFVDGCINLERVKVTNTGKVINWYFAFRGLSKIKSIEELDFSSASDGQLNNAFRSTNPTRFIVVLNTLSKSINLSAMSALDDESRQSVIDGLADLTEQTTQTVTWHSSIIEKLTDEQIIAMSNKNWQFN